MRTQIVSRLLLILTSLFTLVTGASGAELNKPDSLIGTSPEPVVELFQSIEQGSIDVKFIPQDASKANVLLRNSTDRVMHIQLPAAFAAVPVLAQFGNNGGRQNFAPMDAFAGGGGRQGGGASQGVGGGFNAGQGQGQGMQGMQFGGLMRIPPGKTRKLKATTVCLEHGKPEPNPRLAYRLIPIGQVTSDQRVADLCRRLGLGEIEQNAAQAAAWHLANGLDWNRLASINRIESRYLGRVPFFTAADLEAAKSLVASLSDRSDSDNQYAGKSLASKN